MEVRINKFLSEAGVCSRREADRQIEAGNVTIGGKTARMGDQVSDGQEVCFCGRPVQKEKEMIKLLLFLQTILPPHFLAIVSWAN